MFNGYHEIGNIRNRALRYFLGRDYFHDSDIHHVDYDVTNSTVTLKISCDFEWLRDPDPGPSRRADKYTYFLIFKDVQYFKALYVAPWSELIYARFKDSVLLRHVNEKHKKRFHHLRISVSGWDWGYLDLIFHQFEIRKLVGQVKLPRKIRQLIPFEEVEKYAETKTEQELMQMADSDDWYQKSMAITKLGLDGIAEIAPVAERGLFSDEADIEYASVIALGSVGGMASVKHLIKYRGQVSTALEKQNINDAIEKIIFRASKMDAT